MVEEIDTKQAMAQDDIKLQCTDLKPKLRVMTDLGPRRTFTGYSP
jgi:hypothetical protein